MDEDVNPYQSPSCDQPADAAGLNKPVARDTGYFAPLVYLARFISFLVFYTLQDGAVVDSLALRHSGFPWKAGVVAGAPLLCLVAWVTLFHSRIPRRFRLEPWQTVQRTPALARHLILWVALIGVTFGCHWGFAPWTAH